MASPTPVPLLRVLNHDLPPYAVEVTPFPFTLGRHSSNHLLLRHGPSPATIAKRRSFF